MRTLNVSFQEEQRIDQTWIRILLLALAFVMFYAIYAFVTNTPDTFDQYGFWLSMPIGFGCILLIWFWKLTTRIDNYGIAIKCPFVNKKVNWSEIKSLKVLDYGFVGGWGIRLSTQYGTVYNTSGKTGLAIQLDNGKKFLVGTQKATELKKIVNKWENTSS
jgi:hypothetical protein